MTDDIKKYSKKEAKDFNILTRLYQYYAMYIVFPLVACWFYKFTYKGLKNIDKKTNYILAPNHISYFDVFAVARAVKKKLGYMAKKELFEKNWWVAKNIRRLGAYAVNREKLEKSTIKSTKELLKTDFDLCIFPQGGIRRNKKLEEINLGFVFFAKMSKRDIVPIGICGLEDYNWKFLKRENVTVTVGKPISYELDETEIIKQWKEQIASYTKYEIA